MHPAPWSRLAPTFRRQKLLACGLALLGGLGFASGTQAQVDVESRRLLTLQLSLPVGTGEERVFPVGFLWFNENEFPWEETALRAIFAGVLADVELSWFVPALPGTAIGVGLDGTVFVSGVTPYVDGERVSRQSYYGDAGAVRVFINRELAKFDVGPFTDIPINVRGTYRVAGRFFRETSQTRNFDIPDDHLLQSIQSALRVGGIPPGGPRGKVAFEALLAVETGYRTGFAAFGPVGAPFPAHSHYQRALASLTAVAPLTEVVTVSGRLTGGTGDKIDQLSAWRIGGNLGGVDLFSLPLRGYYTREFLAEDFGLANLELALRVVEEHALTLHFYGDYAAIRTVPPQDGEWHSYFGVGAGVSFTTVWGVNVLVNYGYGINAVRNGNRGGHEIGLALRKEF